MNDVTTTTLSSPVIGALADGRFVVAWTDPVPGDVRARIFDPNGGASGAEFIVNNNTTGSQNAQAATGLPDGRFVILFGSPDGAGSGVFGQLYDASGAPPGEVFRVNTTIAGAQFSVSGYTVAPLADGQFAATWVSSFNAVDDIVTQIFDARDAGVTVAGSPGNDAYIGTTFDNSLSGGGGSDALLAADGNDILNGGSGSDELDGGAGIDTAVYSGTHAQYQVTQFANGSVHVSDLARARPTAPTSCSTSSSSRSWTASSRSTGLRSLQTLPGPRTTTRSSARGRQRDRRAERRRHRGVLAQPRRVHA